MGKVVRCARYESFINFKSDAMLKNEVQSNASKVLQLLANRGKLTIREIESLTDYNKNYVYITLGWLLKENKISLSDYEGGMFVEMTNTLNEIYY